MADRTLASVKEGIIAEYRKEYPNERLNGKIFSIYLLDRYARLLLRLYKKAKDK